MNSHITSLQSVARSMSRHKAQKERLLSPIWVPIRQAAPNDVVSILTNMKPILLDTFGDWLEVEDPMGTVSLDDLTTPKKVARYKDALKRFIKDLQTVEKKIDDLCAFQIAHILNLEYLPSKKSIWSKLLQGMFL